MRDGWQMLAHAIQLVETGSTRFAPGVAVRRDGAESVAVIYGGHRGMVDRDAVIRAARANLEDWPELISRVEIEEDEPLSRFDKTAMTAAKAKRERKAARWRARA